MAIIIKSIISCDVCGIVYGDRDMHNTPGTIQRKEMIAADWVFSNGKDYCPNCRKKRKDGKNFSTPKIARRGIK